MHAGAVCDFVTGAISSVGADLGDGVEDEARAALPRAVDFDGFVFGVVFCECRREVGGGKLDFGCVWLVGGGEASVCVVGWQRDAVEHYFDEVGLDVRR